MVGAETIQKAYFANDPASMAQVKRAINELVAADKRSPESVALSSTLPSPRQNARSPIGMRTS